VGFALGNQDAIAALESVKAPVDFNQYLGILRMGVTALKLPRDRLRRDATTWQRRASTMVSALQRHAGWQIEEPRSCMYLWGRLPKGLTDDKEFCVRLLQDQGVALSPGSSFGPGGAGYVRFALVQPEEVLEDAAAKIGAFLAAYEP
jgi:aspartate/methionine/tyrosine aminotransferase